MTDPPEPPIDRTRAAADDTAQVPGCAPPLRVSDVLWRDLHAHARQQVRRLGRDGSLNATALVNEAWIRLADGDAQWESREHFVALMARVMRHLLVDRLRRQRSSRHGGDVQRITLSGLDQHAGADCRAFELLAVDAALAKLRELDPRLEQVAEMRFFGGLSVAEVANVLQVSSATIKRDSRSARAFLAMELGG